MENKLPEYSKNAKKSWLKIDSGGLVTAQMIEKVGGSIPGPMRILNCLNSRHLANAS